MRFTENEQRAIVELVCCIKDSLLDVWSPARHAGGSGLGEKHTEVSSEPEDQISSDSNPTPAFLNQVANDTDIVVVSSFDVEFELENEISGGKMQVVLPIHTLKALNKMGEKAGVSGRSEEEDWHALLKREFLDLCVEVRAELGSGTVTLGELMARMPGTLWPKTIAEEVAAMVSGVPLFTGKLGVHHGNRAIQVTSLHAGGRLLQQAVQMSASSEPGAHEHAE
jgi:flagellar motor switch protein FliM